MTVRSVLSRSPALRSAWHGTRRAVERVRGAVSEPTSFEDLGPQSALSVAYEVMLGRAPDPVGTADRLPLLESGQLSRQELVQMLRGSDEFNRYPNFSARTLGYSIHAGRCQFVRGLPRAARILDLGGAHLGSEEGAMVCLGYPYPFEELVVIDLPSDERHEIYQSTRRPSVVETPVGTVRYQYHSMTDLSPYEDETFDLVYSGQSIEHVTPEDGASVFAQVQRILRPGGYFALDTPNARVTRLQSDEFIDPDHEIEYVLAQLEDLARDAGFRIVEVKGLNFAGASLAAGKFDADEVARHPGLFAEAADCYILCMVCQKPEAA